MVDGQGWTGLGYRSWADATQIRDRLAAGADPDAELDWSDTPLHRAAVSGTPEVIALLAARVRDVDALRAGRTALWQAVDNSRHDNARALAAAGADPWLPMMSGWSPGRLALAGPEPELFGPPPPGAGLTDAERDAVAEARRLIAALGEIWYDGIGLACVAGLDAAEVVRRLDATPVPEAEATGAATLDIVGVTDVPGGCVVTQPWGYAPQQPGVLGLVSVGTRCYGLYANPKSGNQGSIAVDGAIEGWDLHPGGWAGEGDPPELVLAAYLYRHRAEAYSCAYAGLRLTDPRAVTGPPDAWVRLPERDWWAWP
ncbi:ankyrin repeat domain-containing protein [Micromonospora sp. HK10]|uniref:ankyrin repeat domain-containing protein n=1 Tax=Micromonospora sp. HK10 TaxID=1538294 RepID=UPI0006273EBE|nr:ankyrin repeat domain-containing protein [Micromonospora sp. HK10]KKK07716.1 ankyrin [Micromonospora sp. HK10]